MVKQTLCILYLILCTVATANETSFTASEKEALEAISIENISASMKVLASDSFEGRGTGTAGYDNAAKYIISQLKEMGLSPAGNTERSDFAQNVPLRKVELLPDHCSASFVQGDSVVPLQMEHDFLMYPDYARERTSVEGDVVFVGYGVTAPDLKYDDYAGIDVRGKVVALLVGAPDTFPNSERAHYSSSLMKDTNAVAHGAIGMLTLRTPDEEERTPWERVIRQSKLPGYRWIRENGDPNQYFPQHSGFLHLHAPMPFEDEPVWTAGSCPSCGCHAS